ncbi:assimilatory sulfite reductase (NADPH) flavoprotein subunit [Arhodomonas aquaeolei]|uniref:assimilatory sulfite reductase (NADPH) flavoprotein subunit n=1 Tax=Arhodomonas aquaeolei TaxID=2369 RepID=UPI00038255DC|nr:assimilatory sulfite reductase (NADPH) flavoprotein subunit [Arhodomonas aquaeolei]
MAQGPLLETNSPLSAEQAEQLNALIASLRDDQMTWLSGYLAGLSAASPAANAESGARTAPAGEALPEITVLYGSQTGNAEGIAELAVERAEARGFAARLADMADFGKKDLKAAANLMVVVSTHGEGDPPDTAEAVHELVNGRKAPKLDDARFAVLALGDSSYENFCQTGRDFDTRLEALGAERVLERVDCDVDYDDDASAWVDAALDRFAELTGASAPAASNVIPMAEARGGGTAAWSKKNPFPAEILDSVVLNGRGSDKETRHIELSLEGSGLTFEPGDAIGVVPLNDPRVVDELLAATGLDGDAALEGGETLRETLQRDYEITTLTRPFLERWAEIAGADGLRRLLGEDARDELREWMDGRQIIDVVEAFPAEGVTAEAFVAALRRLPPRLYSIASSQQADEDEVHLTVAVVRYETHGREREGVASTYLADRLEPGQTVGVYVDRNKNFKLPADPSAATIMIGPGTGVAPFRAFLAEREETGADGRNWLFFGDRHFQTDFLYQADFLAWRDKGVLDRIDVAFSRDQAEKVYVQDRLRENGAEIYAWLQQGAHVYVCGDADRMAGDVHAALTEIVREHGGLDEQGAADYLRALQKDKRYQRDVY